MAKLTKAKMRKKKAITLEHVIPADEAQALEWALANQKLTLARFGGDAGELVLAEAQVEKVRKSIQDTGLILTFHGIGRLRFEQIVREHPPTAEQKAQALTDDEDEPTWNPDTFWAALLAETVDSDLTVADWQSDVIDSPAWGIGEIDGLRKAALAVNTSNRVVELGN